MATALKEKMRRAVCTGCGWTGHVDTREGEWRTQRPRCSTGLRPLLHIPYDEKLLHELNAETRKRLAHETDPSASAFHEGFLHALEQTLSFKHGTDLLLDEKISRGEFHESWEQVMRRLTPVEEG